MAAQYPKKPIQIRCKQAYHYRISHKREDRNAKGEHCAKGEIFTVERIYKNWCLLDNGYWLPIRIGKEILLIPENFDWYMVNVAPGVSYRFKPDPAAIVPGVEYPKQYELLAGVSLVNEWIRTWDGYWLPLCVRPNGQLRFLFSRQRCEEVAYPDRLVVTRSSRPGLDGTYQLQRDDDKKAKLRMWMGRPIWAQEDKKSKLFRWQNPQTEWVIDDELVDSPTVFACPEVAEDVRHPAEARSTWMVYSTKLNDFEKQIDMLITPHWEEEAENTEWEDDIDKDDSKAKGKGDFADEDGAGEEDDVAELPTLTKKLQSAKNSWILKGIQPRFRRGRRTATIVAPPPVRGGGNLTLGSIALPESHRLTLAEEAASTSPAFPPSQKSHVPVMSRPIRQFPRSEFHMKAWSYLEREEAKKHASLVKRVDRHLQRSPGAMNIYQPSQSNVASNGISIGHVSFGNPAVGQLNSNAKVFNPGHPNARPQQHDYGVAAPNTAAAVLQVGQVSVVSPMGRGQLHAQAVPFTQGQIQQPVQQQGQQQRRQNMQSVSLLDIQFQPATRPVNPTKAVTPSADPKLVSELTPPKQFGPALLTATNGFSLKGPTANAHGEGQSQPEGQPENIMGGTPGRITIPTTQNPHARPQELSPFANPFTTVGFPPSSNNAGDSVAANGQQPNGAGLDPNAPRFPENHPLLKGAMKPGTKRPERGKDLGQCFYHNQLCRASAIVGYPDEVYVDTFLGRHGVVCHRVSRNQIRLATEQLQDQAG